VNGNDAPLALMVPIRRTPSARTCTAAPARWWVRVVVSLVVPAAFATACSGGSGATATSTTTPAPATTTASSAPPTASSPAAADAAALSGSWSGRYSGSYTGTFALTWTGSGSTLKGTIKLSDPSETLSLTGIVKGNTITFGTVGSTAITYAGTVSGNSMSGTYELAGTPGGPWSASRAA
jgi:hypothetical protein